MDYEQQQILRKLEDDALANARQKAQDDAKAELEKPPESQPPVETEEKPLDSAEITG
jgi:hypothetical protein